MNNLNPEENWNLNYYSQSVNEFNCNEFQKALESFNLFCKTNKISDNTYLSFEKSFFQILIYYNLAKLGETQYFNKAISTAIKRKIIAPEYGATHAASFCKVSVLIGECYLFLNDTEAAIKQFENVVQFDISNHFLPIQLKLLKLYSDHFLSSKAKSLAYRVSSREEFKVPCAFIMLDLAISELNKSDAFKHITLLEKSINRLEPWQQSRLINKTLDISLYNIAQNQINSLNLTNNELQNFTYERASIKFYYEDHEATIAILNSNKETESDGRSLNLLAKAYDKQKQYDIAFSYFTKSANIQKLSADVLITTGEVIDYIESYKKSVLPSKEMLKKQSIKNVAPVFMIGFPRSGTTLLDSILNTQNNVTTLSERSTIVYTINYMTNVLKKHYPSQLNELSELEIDQLREIYFHAASLYINDKHIDFINNPKKVLIDKMPMNVIHLPLILLLFPHAKIILSRRNPLDCVLSCFQQNFTLNNEMSRLTTLEDCMNRFIQLMSLFERYQEAYNMNILSIKYEDLVNNLPKEINRLVDFLGVINFSNDYLNFNKKNSQKILRTASRDQASKELYTTSVKRWLNYKQHLLQVQNELSEHLTMYKIT